MIKKWATRMMLLLGAIAVSTVALAGTLDATITIDRTESEQTLSIRYTGASVALIELLVNGISHATRTANPDVTRGESTFVLDPSVLQDGQNDLLIKAYDRAGKLVGTKSTTIKVERAPEGLAFIEAPPNGGTVQGTVEVKLGLRREMKNIYVSFFVDNDFKSLKNFPPYTFVLDTTRIANGWHDIEAWVVDDSNNTIKTRMTRMFVNNPGGRTNRVVPAKPVEVSPTTVGPKAEPGSAAGMKAPGLEPRIVAPRTAAKAPGRAPLALSTTSPRVIGFVGSLATTRIVTLPTAIVMSAKLVVPSLPKLKATVASAPKPRPTEPKTTAARISVSYGTRLPDTPKLTVLLNSSTVNFDVMPRITNGVPLTPFRHLFEKSGGKVKWTHESKSVHAFAPGSDIRFQIGADAATVNQASLKFEVPPFIERGRTVVPLSFIRDALGVNVDFDVKTGHVLITSQRRKN